MLCLGCIFVVVILGCNFFFYYYLECNYYLFFNWGCNFFFPSWPTPAPNIKWVTPKHFWINNGSEPDFLFRWTLVRPIVLTYYNHFLVSNKDAIRNSVFCAKNSNGRWPAFSKENILWQQYFHIQMSLQTIYTSHIQMLVLSDGVTRLGWSNNIDLVAYHEGLISQIVIVSIYFYYCDLYTLCWLHTNMWHIPSQEKHYFNILHLALLQFISPSIKFCLGTLYYQCLIVFSVKLTTHL